MVTNTLNRAYEGPGYIPALMPKDLKPNPSLLQDLVAKAAQLEKNKDAFCVTSIDIIFINFSDINSSVSPLDFCYTIDKINHYFLERLVLTFGRRVRILEFSKVIKSIRVNVFTFARYGVAISSHSVGCVITELF